LERSYARNEPRDLYDLWHLTNEGLIDFGTLLPEVEAKLTFRGRTLDAMTAELATKEARYKKHWTVRLGRQLATLPPFDDVFRAVRRSLRDAGLVKR
jgi:predicted nucleotidyltransferase component of viral defense system